MALLHGCACLTGAGAHREYVNTVLWWSLGMAEHELCIGNIDAEGFGQLVGELRSRLLGRQLAVGLLCTGAQGCFQHSYFNGHAT